MPKLWNHVLFPAKAPSWPLLFFEFLTCHEHFYQIFFPAVLGKSSYQLSQFMVSGDPSSKFLPALTDHNLLPSSKAGALYCCRNFLLLCGPCILGPQYLPRILPFHFQSPPQGGVSLIRADFQGLWFCASVLYHFPGASFIFIFFCTIYLGSVVQSGVTPSKNYVTTIIGV